MTRFAWPSIEWGVNTVTVLSDGLQHLDGGAMFGVVPKVLWSRIMPADNRNRIRLGMNSLLIEGPDGRVIVETGSGGKDDEKFQSIYGLEREGGLVSRLEELGVGVETVDRVFHTHLHFDHAGGATRFAGDGETVVPTFPLATYYFNRGEYEDAMSPNERNAASYLPRNYAPLVEADRVEWVADGDTLGSISVIETPGHTEHHCSIAVDDGAGRRLVFLGDLVPTTHHLPYPYIMAYDLYPVTTLETRHRVLRRAHEEDWLCAFVHDADTPLAYLRPTDRGRFEPDPDRDPWKGGSS